VLAKKVDGNEYSTTAAVTELRISNSDEVLQLPVMVATTVWDIKELLSTRLGIDSGAMQFVTKQGPYWREQNDCEEIRRKVLVRGIKSFERSRMEYPHPMAVIGAGHIGLRQAMVFLKAKEHNFVLFDRKPKVGGQSWWDQANTASKLQTELGVYHLGWDETLPLPTTDYPWPSRDEILKDFEDKANELGLMPYIRLNTDVVEVQMAGQKENATYEFSLRNVGDFSGKVEKFMTSAIMMYPGNLSVPRRETYIGEDLFGGIIAYGMFNELDYNVLRGKNVAIVGHGAFAVENVRTCLEYSAGQMYLVCRRKNLSCPRFVSWLVNQSNTPVSGVMVLNTMKPMYDLVGFDPWNYYAVQANASRTSCSIMQKARFGIGDVYFLAVSWGKLEVIEDPLGVKRLSEGALHCGNGRKLEVSAVLKLLGFVGNFENDRLLKIKELVGFWVNEDPKRWLVAEPVSVMASNFGGTSFSPGAIAWVEAAMWFVHHPEDFWKVVMDTGLVPRHKTNGEDIPAYVVDARHGTQTLLLLGACIPWLGERGAMSGKIKVHRMATLHPIDKFVQYCKEDWDYYCDKLRKEGLSGPEFPYTPDVAHKYFADYQAEDRAAIAKSETQK